MKSVVSSVLEQQKASGIKPIVQSNNVVVGVRIRPANQKEIDAEMQARFTSSDDALNVQELNEENNIVKNWSYDYVFGPDCSNQYIFHSVGINLVDSALDGYNAVLFMYGQTSSGKTFTLFGGGSIEGLVGHTLSALEERVNKSEDSEYLIKMTYSELYNEELKDLLSIEPNENLKIIDDPMLGPMIQNVTEVPFSSAAAAKKSLEEGERRRHFGVTNMNAHSSRSHVLVRLSIESRKVGFRPTNPMRSSWGKDKPTSVSTLNLVDLAGSERSNKAGTTGESLKEGSYINKSLLTLGTVISSLSEGKEGSHIPYRNSKLTRLLAGALGGNAKTTMITCISPASGNVAESQSTLRFAQRAKKIVNKVKKNDVMDAKTLASKLVNQNDIIEQLKQQMQKAKDMGFSEDFSGESIKDKAVAAAKSLRSIKFLMTITPKLIKCLKDKAMHAQAEELANDLKQALANKVDMAEVIKRGQDVVEKYLPQETKILTRFMDVQEANESEIMYDVSELAVDVTTDDAASDVEEAVGELFALQGGPANPEETEFFQMRYEDLLMGAHGKVSHLTHMSDALVKKVAQFKNQYEEAHRTNESLKSDLAAAAAAQKNLQEDAGNARMEMKKQMEQLRANMNNMLVRGGETTQILKEQVDELNRKIDSQDTELRLTKESKKRLDKEISFLRAEVGNSLDREKEYISEQTKREQIINEQTTEIQRLKSELAAVVTPLAISDKNNVKLRQTIAELHQEHEHALRIKTDRIDQLERLCAETAFKLEDVKFKLKVEASSAHTDREANERSESKLKEYADSTKQQLEAQLSEQVQLNSTLQEKIRVDKLEATHRIDLLISQNTKLKAEADKLNETVKSYEQFVESEIANVRESGSSGAAAALVEEQKAREFVRQSVLNSENDEKYFPVYTASVLSLSPAPKDASAAAREGANGPAQSAVKSTSSSDAAAANGARPSKSVASVNKSDKNNSAAKRATVTSETKLQDLSPASRPKIIAEVKGAAREKEKNKQKQREFLNAPAPVVSIEEEERRGAAHLSGLMSDTLKFRAVRLSLALTNASLSYSTGELLAFYDFVNTQNRGRGQQLTHATQALEIAKDERAALQLAKVNLDKNNALCVHRERTDEDYIRSLEAQLSTLRDQFTALCQELTDIQEENKQALAANEIMEIKYKNLRCEKDREEKEKKAALKQSQAHQTAMEEALEQMYLIESQLNLREQEMSVLKVERDELAQRFYVIGSVDATEFSYDVEEKSSPEGFKGKVKAKRRESLISKNSKNLGLGAQPFTMLRIT